MVVMGINQQFIFLFYVSAVIHCPPRSVIEHGFRIIWLLAWINEWFYLLAQWYSWVLIHHRIPWKNKNVHKNHFLTRTLLLSTSDSLMRWQMFMPLISPHSPSLRGPAHLQCVQCRETHCNYCSKLLLLGCVLEQWATMTSSFLYWAVWWVSSLLHFYKQKLIWKD